MFVVFSEWTEQFSVWKTTGKDSSEACAIACQTRAVYSVFSSGVTSHSKIVQFNWKCIAPLMSCHKNNCEHLVFCPDYTNVSKPKGTVKASAQGNVAFWMTSYLLRDQGMTNIRTKFSYMEQQIYLHTVSFITVCIALSHLHVFASHRGSQSLNPSHYIWDIWWMRWYRERVLNEHSPYHVTMSYQ
jgi:hypothetical protein